MKHKEIAPCISVYEDVFDPSKAVRFLSTLEEEILDDWNDLTWGDSGVGAGTVTAYRTSLSCSLIPLMKPYPETELSKFFTEHIKEPVEEVVDDYRKQNLLPNAFHEPFSVLKYMEEAEYHAHYDHFRDNARVFSLVAMLSEPEEGGELEFPVFDVTARLGSGSMVLFPSNFPYLHIAHPVTRGTKYSMVTWYS
jgi:hypothetical protein